MYLLRHYRTKKMMKEGIQNETDMSMTTDPNHATSYIYLSMKKDLNHSSNTDVSRSRKSIPKIET